MEVDRAEVDQRGALRAEVWLVLGVSLGASAVYALVTLVARLTATAPISQQTASLNTSASARPWLDLTYQLLGIVFDLVPVLLALHLLQRFPGSLVPPVGRALGIDLRRPGFDLSTGAGLAALIGLPGLLLYLAGRELGITPKIVPAALPDLWWTVPVLILAAAQNAILEEVVVVGYLLTRLHDLSFRVWPAVLLSAALRGSYHLYQGVGMGIGNFVMGLVFGWFFVRYRRVMPLIIAHTVLDIVSFVGYALLADHLPSFLR